MSLVQATLWDGCVGETLASLEAAAAAEICEPSLRGALETIAEDESRHAAFAFEIVRWALRSGTVAEVSAMLAAIIELDARLANQGEGAPDEAERGSAKAGKLSSALARPVRRDGADLVIRPLLAALVGETSRPIAERISCLA